ncbi:putative tartrate transporter [Zancudomyces culisetae]|uniref:Putative tartrate transporter n=1 Tax=Zancudomyces culisetae TaxID=1213189 RepID=A0A1R1PKU2_ZANCU|nr:putative tartrate transporter [Zancudomyces culisetae]|eukprot:OMH81557.1 putative tartrate transporter [Zancudomyces culisetae]
MDRTNIGAAFVNGLITELNLDSRLQTLVTSIFYVFYVSLELPSNILLKQVKPRNWFAFISIAWSIICMLQALAKTSTVFIVFRALLGAVESGFAPGMLAYLPYWYTRDEIGFRMSIFFASIPVAGIIGNPIAAGLASLKTSLKPYQMIFLVEGAATILFGIASFFILQNYPETCTFLTIEERDVLVKKLKADQGLATKAKLSVMSSIKAIFDWKTGVYCFGLFTINNCVNLISIFGPTLMKALKFSSVNSTYLATVPCVAGLIAIIISYFIPKRVPLYARVAAMNAMGAIFLALLAFGKGLFLRMFSFTLFGFFVYPAIPIFLSWLSVNQGGIAKRLIVSAIAFSCGNISGAIIPTMFTTKHAPNFVSGFVFILSSMVILVVLVLALAIYYTKENEKKTNNPIDVSHLSEDEQQMMYNNHPQFRYTL